jgi:hypothetical protein
LDRFCRQRDHIPSVSERGANSKHRGRGCRLGVRACPQAAA